MDKAGRKSSTAKVTAQGASAATTGMNDAKESSRAGTGSGNVGSGSGQGVESHGGTASRNGAQAADGARSAGGAGSGSGGNSGQGARNGTGATGTTTGATGRGDGTERGGGGNGGAGAPSASGGATGSGNPPSNDKKQQSRPKRSRPSKSERKEAAAKSAAAQIRFHCNYCGRDLSNAIRARCAVCPDYDSCLDCFSVGATLNPHKPNHPYRLIQVCDAHIFQGGWGADEEEKLLEGLELYGVGNWEEVARVIGTKNPLETERHYMRTYLQSSSAPLPDVAKLVPFDKDPPAEDYDVTDPKELRVMHHHQQEDAAGWMSKRGDFVYEWDNEAEELLGDMEITPDDSKRERELKMRVLEIYCHKLDERQRRKDFVLERNLTDTKLQQTIEKKRSKEERDIREKLKVFARFLSPNELDRFVKGLTEERALRAQLDAYREARLSGATTVEEANAHRAAAAKAAKAKQEPAPPPPPDPRPRPSSTSSQNRSRSARKSLSSAASQAQASTDAIKAEDSLATTSNAPGTAGSSPTKGASAEGKEQSGKVSFSGEAPYELQPGAELMSRAEISLCQSLKLAPHQYLILKDFMVRESVRSGMLRKKDAKIWIRLDSTKVSKVYDYLLACGWIRSGPVAGAVGRTPSSATAGVGKR